MEALTAVSVAALTIYDMCKAVDWGDDNRNIRLVTKNRGKSGNFQREGEDSGKIVLSAPVEQIGDEKENVGRGCS
jgi:hypothetical protein